MENPNNISMNVDNFGAIATHNDVVNQKIGVLKFNLRLKMRIGHIEIKLKEKTNYEHSHIHTMNSGVSDRETERDETNSMRSETENF